MHKITCPNEDLQGGDRFELNTGEIVQIFEIERVSAAVTGTPGGAIHFRVLRADDSLATVVRYPGLDAVRITY